MKIAVTGATGLIGHHVVDGLAHDGLSLSCLTRREPPSEGRKNVRWLRGDLSRDEIAAQLLEEQDVVIHLANETVPLSASTDPVSGLQMAALPTLKLLEAVKRGARTPHLIYFSSGGAIYGEPVAPGQPFRESDRCEPLTEYGIQKLFIERMLHRAALAGDVRCTVLRVSNAYGAPLDSQRVQGLIGTSVTRIKQGQPLRLIGNPANVRDYVHLADLLEATRLALRHPGTFEVFNIGSGEGHSVREVIDTIVTVSRRPSPGVETMDVSGSQLLSSWSVLDITKARKNLGWTPKVSLRAGIESMYSDARHP